MPKGTLSVSVALCAVLLFGFSALPLGAQNRNYPNFASIDAATAQVSLIGETGIGASNSAPISLKAQLIRKAPDQPPFQVLPMTLASYAIQSIAGPTFNQSCSLQNSATVLSCDLTPTGATWTAGTIRMRVRLDSTDGYAASSFTTFTIGVLAATIQTAMTTVPGKGPATTNAEPVYLTAQLIRPTSPLPTGELLPIQITAYALTPVLGGYTATCNAVPTTKLECTLTPTSGKWALPAQGQITLRAHLTAWDGGTSNSLLTLPVSGPGYSLQTSQFCGTTGCPGNLNANQEIITALVSKTSALGPGVEPFHSISSFLLESVYPDPSAFTLLCTNLTTMVKCTLSPSGATWVGGTQVFWRIRVTTTDGVTVLGSGNFRVN